MSINQIECFIATYEYGSFAMAAKAMFKSPAAIAKQVHALEQSLGCQLFNQEGSTLQASSFAKLVYEQANTAMTEYQKLYALRIDNETKGVKSVTLAIAAQPVRGSILPPYLESLFKKRFPGITCNLLPLPNGECATAVEEGLADGALMMPTGAEQLDYIENVYSFNPLVVVSAQHRLSTFTSIELKQLEGERIALPMDLRFFYKKALGAFNDLGVEVKFEQAGYSINSHKKFLDSGGLAFVTPDPRLNALFPKARFIKVTDSLMVSKIALVTKVPCTPEAQILKVFAALLENKTPGAVKIHS